MVHFIEHNLRPGEVINEQTPWRILLLDKFEAHLAPAVQAAAAAKKYVLIIIPGGLTGDVQVCDTDLNHRFKDAYKLLEEAWLQKQLLAKKNLKGAASKAVGSLTPTRELISAWAKQAYKAALKHPGLLT